MKELSIEEKARAYDEALEKTKQIIMDYDYDEHDNVFMEIFPELRESEDKMVKNCISMILTDANETRFNDFHTTLADCLAWLERQNSNVDNANKEYWRGYREGKQEILDKYAELEKQGNPTDKSEPKFKVGDILVSEEEDRRHIYKVDAITNYDTYLLLDLEDGYTKNESVYTTDLAMYLWTIDDAKKGDVLVCKGNVKYSNGIKYERICLFNNLDNAFFTLTKTSNFVEEYDIDVNIDYPDNTVLATKEQKEILFMVMKEAGYEWDAEKKELKKIKQNSRGDGNKKLTDVNHEYFSELLENNNSKDINDYAYQVAYCMSHDWIEETATWDDVQKACKLGAQFESNNNISFGELKILEQSIEKNKIVDSTMLKRLLKKLKNIC